MPIAAAIFELVVAIAAAYFAPLFFKTVIDFNERLGVSLCNYASWASRFRRIAFIFQNILWPLGAVAALWRHDWTAAIGGSIVCPLIAHRFRVVADRFPQNPASEAPRSA